MFDDSLHTGNETAEMVNSHKPTYHTQPCQPNCQIAHVCVVCWKGGCYQWWGDANRMSAVLTGQTLRHSLLNSCCV